jgi:hypothetical protein
MVWHFLRVMLRDYQVGSPLFPVRFCLNVNIILVDGEVLAIRSDSGADRTGRDRGLVPC